MGEASQQRATLTIQVENIPAEERRYFSSLEQLCTYLHERVEALLAPNSGKGGESASPPAKPIPHQEDMLDAPR
jgi:hypothetical protein